MRNLVRTFALLVVLLWSETGFGQATVVLSEGFESPASPGLPTGWTTTVARRTTGDWFDTTLAAHGGTQICYNINSTLAQTLFTPVMSFTGLAADSVAFWARRSATYNANLSLDVSTDAGATWTVISNTFVTTISTTGFNRLAFGIPTIVNNQANVMFRYVNPGDGTGTGGTTRMDDIVITGISSTLVDGAGTGTIANGGGTYIGSTIFSRATGGTSVTVTITGVVAGNLDKVKLTVPSTWVGYSSANVTVGGAFTGNTPVFAGNDIQINAANLGTTPGTITITSLTTPNPLGALLNGNDTWTVQTAKSGGTLTSISELPISYTIIPIANIRTGGTDGFGNSDAGGNLSAMAGQTVAIQGVATVEPGVLNTTSFTSFFMQEAGYGMQVFRSGAPVVTWGRGDILTVKGSVNNFNGGMELIPATGSSPDFYNLGPGSLPVPVVLANAAAVNESNEGKLVQLNSVSYDSVGQSFIATAANRGANNFHTSADTGSIWLHSVNPIVGKIIPATGNIVGVVYQRNDQVGLGQTARKIAPRGMVDLGLDPAAGSGTATISPIARFASVTGVNEVLTLKGDGVNTLNVVTVTIPSTWTWTDTSAKILSGSGLASAHFKVTGDGSGANPYVISLTGAALTNVDSGIVTINSLNTPGSVGLTTWSVKTGIDVSTIQPVSSLPTVNIVTSFSAIQTGNWSSGSTWAGGNVPGAADDVSISTLHIAVTIDISNAVCHNLTILGSGTDTTGGGSGPVLKFSPTGSPQLTVNGALSVSGGSGGGGGNRGGRSQLTSNGNASAILIVKGNVTTTSSNTTTNGNAGLNMNEGTVKLIGATSDSIVIGAGHRLGNLEIGDGSSAKTVSTSMTVASATMAIRSLTVRQGSTFWIGSANNTDVLTVGSNSAGIPILNGGITVLAGGSLRVQLSTAGQVIGTINLFGGGITNNGTLDLLSFALAPELTHCHYNVIIDSTDQTVGGSNAGSFADVVVGTGRTLTLQSGMNLGTGFAMTLNGTLVEAPGKTVVGTVQTARTVAATSTETFGGMGLQITSGATAPGLTIVSRTTGVASVGGTHTSILRYFDIAPTVNSGLAATLRYFYDNTELAGQNPTTLSLWRSPDVGATWALAGGTVDTSLHRIQLAPVDSFSRWTASDAAHPLSGSSTVNINTSIANGWNMISNPVTSAVPDDSAKHLFPTIISRAFEFVPGGGYQGRDTMGNRKGYWGKFPGATTNLITGSARTRDTISVVAGWNMVGSISNTVDTATIVQIPAGIKASNWFGFVAGYAATSPIVPGKAYWVKVNATGKFVFANPLGAAPAKAQAGSVSPLDALNTLTITDSRGGSQTLYFGADAKNEIRLPLFDMPPAPPVGVLDARFETSSGGSMVQTHQVKVSDPVSFPVKIQSDAYPVTVTWKINGGAASYEMSDGVGGRVFRAKEMTSEGSIKITNSDVNKVVVNLMGDGTLPAEYALSQNYPNPFNPTTNIKYALPVQSRVTMFIYNVLGQRVRTLMNDDVAAGYHIAEWDGTGNSGQQVASGTYFLQLSAQGTNGKTFNEVKKLVMLK